MKIPCGNGYPNGTAIYLKRYGIDTFFLKREKSNLGLCPFAALAAAPRPRRRRATASQPNLTNTTLGQGSNGVHGRQQQLQREDLLVWVLNSSLPALAAAALAPVLLLPRPDALRLGAYLRARHHRALRARRLVCVPHPPPLHRDPRSAPPLHRDGMTHATLALAALAGQGLASVAFFLRYDHSLRLLGSARDCREQFMLSFLEEVLLLAMFLSQVVALAATCGVGRHLPTSRGDDCAAATMAWRRGRVATAMLSRRGGGARATAWHDAEKVLRKSVWMTGGSTDIKPGWF
ncbi:hypothetical protein ACP4OV_007189 [Aristida adscensionis]